MKRVRSAAFNVFVLLFAAVAAVIAFWTIDDVRKEKKNEPFKKSEFRKN